MSGSNRFLIGFFGGIVGLILVIALFFAALDETGRLKAPSFANRLTFDEKLRYLREQPHEHVEALAIGSSTTLHGLDGAELRRELGFEGEIVNLGVQDLRVDQVRFLAEIFLEQYSHVNLVIMISTLLDYKNCDAERVEFFDPEHVLDYIHGGWKLYYYFKYLDLGGILKRAVAIDRLRETSADLSSVSFDRYGSLLLEVPRERINQRVWVGDPIILDAGCYAALHELAEDLRDRDIRFTFVIAPMRPGYLAGRDPDGTLLAEHRRRVQEVLDDTEALAIDAHAALAMPEEAFFDAYHLNRDKATRLTQFVAESLNGAIRAANDQRAPPAAPQVPGGGSAPVTN